MTPLKIGACLKTSEIADHGVECGRGQNDTLRVFAMSLHDIQDGIFVDAEISRYPAVAAPFADSLDYGRCEFVGFGSLP